MAVGGARRRRRGPGAGPGQDRVHHQVPRAVLHQHGGRRQGLRGRSTRGSRSSSARAPRPPTSRGRSRSSSRWSPRACRASRMTPVDPTVATALDKAIAAGVKVVLMDNNIPDWQGRTALATTDNLAAGKLAGEYLKTVLKPGDTLGILEGVPGVPSLDDRVNGMLAGLGGRRGQHRRPRRHQLHRGARHQRRRGPPDREPGPEGDLFRLRSARGRRRHRRSSTPARRPTTSSSSASTSAAARPRR